jgi:hypothetical protein
LVFSLERAITLSAGRVKDKELNKTISEKEDALRDMELETAKLVRSLLQIVIRCLLLAFFHFLQGTITCSLPMHLYESQLFRGMLWECAQHRVWLCPRSAAWGDNILSPSDTLILRLPQWSRGGKV